MNVRFLVLRFLHRNLSFGVHELVVGPRFVGWRRDGGHGLNTMNMSLGFCFPSANIRSQRCFGLECLEFEAGYSSTSIDQHVLQYGASMYLHTTLTTEFSNHTASQPWNGLSDVKITFRT